MRTFYIFAMALTFIVLPSISFALEGSNIITIPNGFLTGEEFLDMSEGAQLGYVMGIIDGYYGAPIFEGDSTAIDKFKNCILGKSNAQIRAIVLKYLNDNPKEWDEQMSVLMFNIINTELCR